MYVYIYIYIYIYICIYIYIYIYMYIYIYIYIFDLNKKSFFNIVIKLIKYLFLILPITLYFLF